MRLAPARSQKVHPESTGAQYLYCIVRCREARTFETLGMGERGDVVRTINFEDLAAVTSDSAQERYDNTRRNMMAHMRVLDEVMTEYTMLPIRFDSVAPSPEAVREQLLEARHRELSKMLDAMEGRIEMGLKAFWYEDVVLQEIVQENPTIRRMRDGLAGRSLEETYYDRIRLGELVEAALKARRVEDAERILERLRPLAEQTRDNPTIVDHMVVNAAFLITRAREAEFDAAVRGLDADIGRRLLIKCVGPVAPYNFVNVSMRWAAPQPASADAKSRGAGR
ncbi:MAG: GvpL/GvpF family gas vesicle protein [Bauldia sp.]|nr:MAG: GvpL/GvpF family gas vesicle protein [Bauldia sp.]MBZ0230094.1 GvpL/GvpF family gas vesicle protein [Bauldia sp.]